MLQFTAIGNIGGDAEFHNENGNSYVSFKVAHNERYTRADGSQVDKTLWVSCILNGDATNLRQYLVKGQLVYVSGDGDVRTYHSQTQHQMVAGVNIRVRQIQLLGSRPDGMPSYVIDEEGKTYNVQKFYNIGKTKLTEVHDNRGNRFNVDKNGWLSSMTEQEQPQDDKTTDANNNVPF